jgi:DNA-binding transcriptional regulator YiaG
VFETWGSNHDLIRGGSGSERSLFFRKENQYRTDRKNWGGLRKTKQKQKTKKKQVSGKKTKNKNKQTKKNRSQEKRNTSRKTNRIEPTEIPNIRKRNKLSYCQLSSQDRVLGINSGDVKARTY